MAAKAFDAKAVAAAVKKQMNNVPADKAGFKKVGMQGTHISVGKAPDGRYFAQFNPSPNPKGAITIASVKKVEALKAEIEQLVATVKVVEALNEGRPASELIEKGNGGASVALF